MTSLDYLVLTGFMLWMLVIGAVFSRRVKNSADMFAAGGQSPWWISGLSGFMTIFSAGTFVVWGGIAYRLGLVAVSLLTVTGMSAVLVGGVVSARWRQMGIATPTEYLRIRFSESVVQLYTWLGFVLRGVGLAVGLYALAVMLAVLVPLEEGTPLRDPATGNLSVNWSIVVWGAVVIAYTMAGGLWAVMMTDVIQCIILSLLVVIAVPLSLGAVGGVEGLWKGVPDGFFYPAAAEFSYVYLLLWFWLGFFRYAADWAFVQRYICVPTPGDARKSAYLMGGLYAVSPIFWMLPAMAYRALDADAAPRDAYVLMCREVLPAGLLGIMAAAMFSATASMVSSLLNVFAGVFVYDVYRPFVRPNASERHLLMVGRAATLLYGLAVIGVAISVPSLGGAENVVLVLVTALLGPLFVPVVWGLYSQRLDERAIWTTLCVCGACVSLFKFAPMLVTSLEVDIAWVQGAMDWVKQNSRMIDAVVGLFPPLIICAAYEFLPSSSSATPGWERMQQANAQFEAKPSLGAASRLPTLLIAASLGMLGMVMIIITVWAETQKAVLGSFAALLLAIAMAMLLSARNVPENASQ